MSSFGRLERPNERMQLTWLPGAPSRPASVHQRAVGQGGLGSAATQLMRAVSWPLMARKGACKSQMDNTFPGALFCCE